MHMKRGRKKRSDRAEKAKLAPLFHFQRTWVNTPNQNLHLELAGQLLRRSLARKDYERAFTIYSTLTSCRSSNEELLWKVGSEILGRNKEYEPTCLQFLKLVLAQTKHYKDSVAVELALYQMRCGHISDARATLEPYINAFAYKDNAQLQGYFGVIEFALFNMAVEEKRASGGSSFQTNQHASHHHSGSFNLLGDSHAGNDEYDDDSDNESTLWDARIMSHKRSAIKHLELALKLDSRNDGFLAYLVRLKCGRVEMTGWDKHRATNKRRTAIREMRAYLKQYYNDNTSSMLALQLLTALENRERQKTLELILALNPAADSELYVRPLVRLMWKALPAEQADVISRITNTKRSEVLDTKGPRDSQHFLHDQASNGLSLEQQTRPDTECSVDEDEVTGQIRSAMQESNATSLLSKHQLDVSSLRPIAQLLLTRAEYNALKPWEEQEICKIALYYDMFRVSQNAFPEAAEARMKSAVVKEFVSDNTGARKDVSNIGIED
ncbi:hypothetical protein BG015_001118 [Linnemannia schmuckeri]|uniref:Uncharacterized protein n=1 Tax=Linnemannia schmuckeri TaxID=64567 RepID=A0A9P5S9E6_9FUNG|nr:hypothetical protein BG015_001118 [Linnemannia schmuckeri]